MHKSGPMHKNGRPGALRGGMLMVGLAGFGLTGFGGWAPQAVAAPSSSVLAQAYHATVKAKTANLSTVITEKLSGQATTRITASGSVNLVTNEGRLTNNSDSGSGSQTTHTILARGKEYLEIPSAAQARLGGKKWIAFPLAKQASSDPLSFTAATELKLLASGATTFRRVGSATVRGESTTEYHVSIDPTKLVPSPGKEKIPMTVYVDHDHRIRRLQMDDAVKSGSGSDASTLRVHATLDLSNYGVHVAVTPPPAGQVSHRSLMDYEHALVASGT